MKLLPVSKDLLRISKPLPFSLRDEGGRLLLAAGERIESSQQLELIQEQGPFALESESADWLRRLQAAMDEAIRSGATLSKVVSVKPVDPPATRSSRPLTLPEQWQELVSQLDGGLRELQANAPGALDRLKELQLRALALLQRKPDAALYLAVYRAGHSTDQYCAHHAMQVMQICALLAPVLGWSERYSQTLALAALTMNLGMQRLQDRLAADTIDPSPAMRAEIERHPQTSAQLLAAAGVADELWLEAVRLHHEKAAAGIPLAELEPPRQLARALRRVDIFTAKLSRRAARAPMSPVQAAREACLGTSGQPDEIGGALLKAVGLYPPGSFVQLTNGEVGIVAARGRRANMPLVATLLSGSGMPLLQPLLRDTADARHAVKGAVNTSAVKVLPKHEAVLALV